MTALADGAGTRRGLGRRRWTKGFYQRDSLEVARALIGCLFVHDGEGGVSAVRLVETEAYRGEDDPGSHGYAGMTRRNRTMFGPAGRIYVYFTYGMHWCVNVVCARDGKCRAVLLRAGEPVTGVELMRMRRNGAADDRLLASGPARLTQAMGISGRHDGATLLRGGRLAVIEDDKTSEVRSGHIAQTPRIGLRAGRGDRLPWRFVVPDSPFASRVGRSGAQSPAAPPPLPPPPP